MENISKSHVVMLCFLLLLLIITPFLSSNIRPTYLYFITNLLIIALGVESGLLSSLFSNKSISQDKTLTPTSSSHNYSDFTHNHSIEQYETNDLEFSKSSKLDQELRDHPFHSGMTEGLVPIGIKDTTIRALSRGGTREKRENGDYNCKLSRGSSSMPSLFFLGDEKYNGDTHSKEGLAYLYEDDGCDGVEEEEDGVINGEISGQELYVKAEAFIGNFYKQLRLQRQNSLKRIYGIYNNT